MIVKTILRANPRFFLPKLVKYDQCVFLYQAKQRETIPAKATVAKKRALSPNKARKKTKLVKASKCY